MNSPFIYYYFYLLFIRSPVFYLSLNKVTLIFLDWKSGVLTLKVIILDQKGFSYHYRVYLEEGRWIKLTGENKRCNRSHINLLLLFKSTFSLFVWKMGKVFSFINVVTRWVQRWETKTGQTDTINGLERTFWENHYRGTFGIELTFGVPRTFRRLVSSGVLKLRDSSQGSNGTSVTFRRVSICRIDMKV